MVLAFGNLGAQEAMQVADAEPDTARSAETENKDSGFKREKRGISWRSENNRFYINPWLRLQTRYSNPFDSDRRNLRAFENLPGSDFTIRRSRLKVGGHLFNPDIKFYFEKELSGERPILDLRLDIDLTDTLSIRAGQYKILYNRHRVDSSGKQQFAERSITTYAFTLDRQRGVSVIKDWAKDTRWDNKLTLAAFEGDSRDPGPKGDDPMLMARWSWQFLGRPVPFTQGDVEFTPEPSAALAFGYAQARGPYTRFSSSGGGQLDGFTSGGDNRYELQQSLVEFAYKHNGLSIQQEYHVKDIEDHEGNEDGRLKGGYLQLGKAFQPAGWAFPIEFAGRYAKVDWDTNQSRTQEELSFAVNLFFSGHDNKLTFDVTQLDLDMNGVSESDMRVRAQWDVSF